MIGAYMVIWLIIELVQRALALGVAEQVLGTENNERLAELPVDLYQRQ